MLHLVIQVEDVLVDGAVSTLVEQMTLFDSFAVVLGEGMAPQTLLHTVTWSFAAV